MSSMEIKVTSSAASSQKLFESCALINAKLTGFTDTKTKESSSEGAEDKKVIQHFIPKDRIKCIGTYRGQIDYELAKVGTYVDGLGWMIALSSVPKVLDFLESIRLKVEVFKTEIRNGYNGWIQQQCLAHPSQSADIEKLAPPVEELLAKVSMTHTVLKLDAPQVSSSVDLGLAFVDETLLSLQKMIKTTFKGELTEKWGRYFNERILQRIDPLREISPVLEALAVRTETVIANFPWFAYGSQDVLTAKAFLAEIGPGVQNWCVDITKYDQPRGLLFYDLSSQKDKPENEIIEASVPEVSTPKSTIVKVKPSSKTVKPSVKAIVTKPVQVKGSDSVSIKKPSTSPKVPKAKARKSPSIAASDATIKAMKSAVVKKPGATPGEFATASMIMQLSSSA